MDIYGKRFIYAGVSSYDYDMILAVMDSSTYMRVSGESKEQSFYGRKSRSNYYLGTNWDDSPASFSVELIHASNAPYTKNQVRALEKWLFNQSGNKKFYVDARDDYYNETTEEILGVDRRLYVNCRFTNPTKLMYNSGVIGFSCTMECDSGWVWQDAITQTETLSGSSNTVTVSVDSDVPDYIYPKIVLTAGSSGGDISIVNQTDDSYRITSIRDVPANSVIVMNSAINYITEEYYESFPDHNFVRFLSGDNTLTINGDVAEITITWSNMRYW